MNRLGKTMHTLKRLRQQHLHREEEERHQDELLGGGQGESTQIERNGGESNVPDVPMPSVLSSTFSSADIVEFRLGELDNLTPLTPEEADEDELAEILQGDDLSFLVERRQESNESRDKASIQTHRIPAEHHTKYVESRNKRRRLSE